MKRFYSATSATALTLALGAGTASADVTAAQVWSDMQDYMGDFGYEITATEQQNGNDLTLSDITMTFDVPVPPETDEAEDMTAPDEEDGEAEDDAAEDAPMAGNRTARLTFTLEQMTLTDNGDGTVDLSLPATLPMTFDVQPPEEAAVSGRIDYTSSGFDMTISGEPGDMRYDYSADSLGMALTEITGKGKTLGPDKFKAMLGLAGVSGQTTMSTAEGLRDISQTVTADEVTYDIDITPPDMPAEDPENELEHMVMKGSARDLSVDGTYTLPQDMDMAKVGEALDAGFSTEASFSYKDGNSAFTFEEKTQSLDGTSSSESGEGSVTMNADELAYRVAGKGMAFEATSSDMPFPVSGRMEEALFHIALPLGPAEEAHDYKVALTLGGLSVSEEIWGMFDPTGTLSHEPATLSLDISGRATPKVSIFDEAEMKALEASGGMPAEVETLNLNALMLKAAGAELTGEGAFTFDNDDLETFGGMPAPDGEVNLKLDGANQLMDKLVEMGILPQQQAMSARMMMGMFAVPGDGEDSLKSTIEVTPDGKVLANGQRIR